MQIGSRGKVKNRTLEIGKRIVQTLGSGGTHASDKKSWYHATIHITVRNVYGITMCLTLVLMFMSLRVNCVLAYDLRSVDGAPADAM